MSLRGSPARAQAISVSAATGGYAMSFGALSVAAVVAGLRNIGLP
jgi:hypothetical protein